MKKVYTYKQLSKKAKAFAKQMYECWIEREATEEETAEFYSFSNGTGGAVLFYKNGEEVDEDYYLYH